MVWKSAHRFVHVRAPLRTRKLNNMYKISRKWQFLDFLKSNFFFEKILKIGRVSAIFVRLTKIQKQVKKYAFFSHFWIDIKNVILFKFQTRPKYHESSKMELFVFRCLTFFGGNPILAPRKNKKKIRGVNRLIKEVESEYSVLEDSKYFGLV